MTRSGSSGFPGALSTGNGGQRVLQILDDVLNVLEADGDPDEVVGHPQRDPLLLFDRGVGHLKQIFSSAVIRFHCL